MDWRIIILYWVCAAAGLCMVVGGIWLIYKEKIYIDRETKQVIKIETLFGKFQTNIPALALFLIGFIPLIYPIYQTRNLMQTEMLKINGDVRSSRHPVWIYAAMRSDMLPNDREFSLAVPVPHGTAEGEQYKVLYLAGNVMFEDLVNPGAARNGEVKLRTKYMDNGASKSVAAVAEIPPRPDRF